MLSGTETKDLKKLVPVKNKAGDRKGWCLAISRPITP